MIIDAHLVRGFSSHLWWSEWWPLVQCPLQAPASAGWWRVVSKPTVWAHCAPDTNSAHISIHCYGKLLAMTQMRALMRLESKLGEVDGSWRLILDVCKFLPVKLLEIADQSFISDRATCLKFKRTWYLHIFAVPSPRIWYLLWCLLVEAARWKELWGHWPVDSIQRQQGIWSWLWGILRWFAWKSLRTRDRPQCCGSRIASLVGQSIPSCTSDGIKRRSFQRVRMEVYGASCIRNCWTWWMLLSSQWPWEWQLNVNSSHTGEPYLGMNQPHWVLSSFDLHNLDQQVPAKGTFWAHTHSCST